MSKESPKKNIFKKALNFFGNGENNSSKSNEPLDPSKRSFVKGAATVAVGGPVAISGGIKDIAAEALGKTQEMYFPIETTTEANSIDFQKMFRILKSLSSNEGVMDMDDDFSPTIGLFHNLRLVPKELNKEDLESFRTIQDLNIIEKYIEEDFQDLEAFIEVFEQTTGEKFENYEQMVKVCGEYLLNYFSQLHTDEELDPFEWGYNDFDEAWRDLPIDPEVKEKIKKTHSFKVLSKKVKSSIAKAERYNKKIQEDVKLMEEQKALKYKRIKEEDEKNKQKRKEEEEKRRAVESIGTVNEKAILLRNEFNVTFDKVNSSTSRNVYNFRTRIYSSIYSGNPFKLFEKLVEIWKNLILKEMKDVGKTEEEIEEKKRVLQNTIPPAFEVSLSSDGSTFIVEFDPENADHQLVENYIKEDVMPN